MNLTTVDQRDKSWYRYKSASNPTISTYQWDMQHNSDMQYAILFEISYIKINFKTI